MKEKTLFVLALVTVVSLGVRAEVRFGAPFAHGMVLQREKPVAVWGTAKAGEAVTVAFAGQTVRATAGTDGRWQTQLKPLAASKEPRVLTASAADAAPVAVTNVLVGEVWLASGQSNMECPLWSADPHYRDGKGAMMIAMTKKPWVRFAKIARGWSVEPKDAAEIVWRTFESESFAFTRHQHTLSAVAFYYARELAFALDIPIGIIDASWGGTNIDAWTPRCGYENHPELKDVADFAVTNRWNAKLAKGVISQAHQQPTVIWNAMVNPSAPYTVRGMIWYQGCHNAGEAERYSDKMHALYDGWSKAFRNPDLRLYFVMLAPWSRSWFDLQLAQVRFAREEKNAAVTVICDHGDTVDIHPNEKEIVGKRLALHALKRDYGFDNIQDEAPIATDCRVEGDRLVVTVENAEKLYIYNHDFSTVAGFEVQDADGGWHGADIANFERFRENGKLVPAGSNPLIGGNRIELVGIGVKKPVACRYLRRQPWTGSVYAVESALPLAPFELKARKEVPPSKCHLDHLDDSVMAIVHFGLNTFTDKEWGYGDVSPSAFNPTNLNVRQWVDAMKAGGIRRVVMVAKHHDGFNLWPSKWNAGYSVAAAPVRTDVVKELRDACVAAGLRFGVYLSPWDRHQASYGTDKYVEYYRLQFEELFEKYGPVSEIWLDGANGGDGWYGGAKETRTLPGSAWDYYRMPDVLTRMRSCYPGAIAFGGAGINSARWPGNEAGVAPDSVWYVTPAGWWETPECDTPLRRGWFWHRNDTPKSLARLVDCYFKSVGRGCVLNLGIAPDDRGLVGADDVARLKEFGDWVRDFNATDLAAGGTLARKGNVTELVLAKPVTVNCVDAAEDLSDGQHIASWTFEAKVGGVWKTLARVSTMGYRRLERFPEVTASSFRIVTARAGREPYRSDADTDGRAVAPRPPSVSRMALRFAKPVPAADDLPTIFPLRKGSHFTLVETDVANEFVYRFANPMKIRSFKFEPSKNAGVFVDRWSASVSADGRTWKKAAEGEFGNVKANPVEQWGDLSSLGPVSHLKIVAERAVDGVPVKWNKSDAQAVVLY